MSIADFLATVHADHERRLMRSGNCAACYPEAAASWHDDARAHRLRPAVVGGLPLDTHERPGAEPTGVGPIRSAGAPGLTVADVVAVSAAASRVDQPDGDLAGARRAIASATPGRKHHPDPALGARAVEETPRSASGSRSLRGAALATQPA